MNRILERKRYWIAGSIVGLAGVALVRIISPELSGAMGKAVMVAGNILAITGIGILACATRRKKSEAFINENRVTGKEQNRSQPVN